jgi:hypothetical protein
MLGMEYNSTTSRTQQTIRLIYIMRYPQGNGRERAAKGNGWPLLEISMRHGEG